MTAFIIESHKKNPYHKMIGVFRILIFQHMISSWPSIHVTHKSQKGNNDKGLP